MARKKTVNRRISHKTRERAAWIEQVLDERFPDCTIPLEHRDPFTLLCAVVLSAQCTDERVNQVTPALFEAASTPQQMARLPIEQIERLIASCGLFRNKAKALQQLSKQICDQYGGQVPSDLETLETLPGVGHKTASVVLVQAFGKPAFPVDTHIARCAFRWGLSPSDDVGVVESILKRLFPESKWGLRHLQIILFAREFCPARGHQVERCPICHRLQQGMRFPSLSQGSETRDGI